MFLDEYHKLIKEGKDNKEPKEDKGKEQQTTENNKNPFIIELEKWINDKNIGKALKCDNKTLIHEIEDKLGSLLSMGNGFWALGLGRLYCAIRQGTNPDNRDAAVADFVNYMSNVLSLLIEEGGEDSKGSLYTPKLKNNRKGIPNARNFNGKSFQQIKDTYDSRVQNYIKNHENPISIKPNGHKYTINKINSVEELDVYEKYFQDSGAEPWNLFGNQAIWNKYTRGGKNTLYVCVRDDVDNTKGEFYDKPSNYPYDDYGLSLFYVILTPAGTITNCTSRYNFVHDLDLTGEYSDSGFRNFFCKDAKRIQEALGIESLNEFYKQFQHGINGKLLDFFDIKHPLYKKEIGNNNGVKDFVYIYISNDKKEYDVFNTALKSHIIYDEFSGFEKAPALVKREGKYRYINFLGKELTYNLNGQEVIGTYDYAEPFKNGRAIVSKYRKYGIINTTGDWIIGLDKNFDCIKRLREGLFSAKVKDKWGVWDINGHERIKPQFNFIGEEDEYGCTIITDKSNKMGVARIEDKSAKILIPCDYKDIFLNEISVNSINQRIAFTILVGADNKIGFCGDFRSNDFKFKNNHSECLYSDVQLNVRYSQLNNESNRYDNFNDALLVRKGDKCVLISTETFKEICEYDEIGYINEDSITNNNNTNVTSKGHFGCAVVKDGGFYGLIDMDGNEVCPCKYRKISDHPKRLNASGDASYQCVNDTKHKLDVLFNENTLYTIVQREDNKYFLLLLNLTSYIPPIEIGIKKIDSDENEQKWIPYIHECNKQESDKEYGWDYLDLRGFQRGTCRAKKKEINNMEDVYIARNGSIITKSVTSFDEGIDYFKIKKMNKVPLFENYFYK